MATGDIVTGGTATYNALTYDLKPASGVSWRINFLSTNYYNSSGYWIMYSTNTNINYPIMGHGTSSQKNYGNSTEDDFRRSLRRGSCSFFTSATNGWYHLYWTGSGYGGLTWTGYVHDD